MSAYWEERKNFLYYHKTLDLCNQYAHYARSVIDIGCFQARFLEWLDWIPCRVALDRLKPPQMPGVRLVQEDFLEWKPTQHFDLALCMQVLEHIENGTVEDFARKLLTIGGIVIVSVPYKWSKGSCVHHLQDPVTVPKLEEWFGRSFSEAKIVYDKGMARLIAVYFNS